MSNYENDDLTKKETHFRSETPQAIKGFIHPIEPLIAALAHYDATKSDRDALFNAIDCNEDVFAWENAEKAALELVQAAFYELTKDRNSRDSCSRIGVETVRKLVEMYKCP